MSGLKEVLLCETCQDSHDEDCGTLGCECWCREEFGVWSGAALIATGIYVIDLMTRADNNYSVKLESDSE